MMKLEHLQSEIEALADDKFDQLRHWMADRDWERSCQFLMMIGKTSQLGIMSPERQLWIVEVDRVRVHQQSE